MKELIKTAIISLKKINNLFNRKFGWFFTNGRKQNNVEREIENYDL